MYMAWQEACRIVRCRSPGSEAGSTAGGGSIVPVIVEVAFRSISQDGKLGDLTGGQGAVQLGQRLGLADIAALLRHSSRQGNALGMWSTHAV